MPSPDDSSFSPRQPPRSISNSLFTDSISHVSEWADTRQAHRASSTVGEQLQPNSADDLFAIYQCFDILERVWPTEPDSQQTAGPFTLEKEIGRGGMGRVWSAIQHKPIQRTVAVKLITPGPQSQLLVKRFESERNVLAMMNHPCIASIIDAGQTEDGQLYFAMELVDGPNLIDYCDQNQLDIKSRLNLFLDACSAVQHAHQKGIIHRDLKPTNILVGQVDGQPLLKVIDFGLSKSKIGQSQLDHSLSNDSVPVQISETQDGQVVGSIRYMSPEQAAGVVGAIDIRSDIYSLGIVLYKLLTDCVPTDDESLRGVSIEEVLESIQHDSAITPSRCLANCSSSKRDLVYANRKISAKAYQRILAEDLDWIVMKAIEKKPDCRYATAIDFASDINRHLSHDAVSARPESRWYSVRKLARKYRGAFVAVAIAATLLALGIATTLLAARWAIIERDYARKAEVTATEIAELRDVELYAMRLKSADREWSLGNCESAWQSISNLIDRSGWELDYLRSKFNTQDEILYGHAAWLESVDTSPDGKWIATGSQDYTIKIWDANSSKLVHTYSHDEIITSVRFSPDSKSLAAGTRKNEALLFSLETYGEPRTFGPFKTDVLCVEFSNSGKQLFAGTGCIDSRRGTQARIYSDPTQPSLLVISIDDNRVIQQLDAHSKDINSICASPAEPLIATCSDDATVKLWNQQENGTLVLNRSLDKHRMEVTDVAFSPSGEFLASGSVDKTVFIWETASSEVVRVISGHDGPVLSVDFDEQGKRIVTGSGFNTARIWSLEGELLKTCRGHFAPVVDAAFIYGKNAIVTASSDKTARIWTTDRSNSTDGFIHNDKVWAIQVSPDNSIVASASADRTVRFIDLATGKQTMPALQQQQAVLALDFRHDSKQLAFAGKESVVQIFDFARENNIQTLTDHDSYIWSLDYSPDSRRLASGSADKTGIVWDTSDWSVVGKLIGHQDEIASIKYSNNGKQIVTASDDRNVILWNSETFEQEHLFSGHAHKVWRACFSPDDSLIASSSHGGEVLLWSVEDKSLVRSFVGHTKQVTGLAFSHCGSRLITASHDRTIRVWDVNTGVELLLIPEHDGEQAVSLSFTSDDSILATGNAGGGISVFTTTKDRSLPARSGNVLAQAMLRFPVVLNRNTSRDELIQALAESSRDDQQFPCLESLRNTGIAHFRLGNYVKAIACLEQSKRIHHMQFGESKFNPYIEAFLAMSSFENGDRERAFQIRKYFDEQFEKRYSAQDRDLEKTYAELTQRLSIP